MPRFTNTKCLEVHQRLRECWPGEIGSHAQISERVQIELHLCFCPSKDWSDEKLLGHRRVMSKADPSLPQRAGRVVKRFERAQAGEVVYVPPVYEAPVRSRERSHAISVRGVRTPEPDLPRLVRAIIRMADEQDRRDDDWVV